MAQTNEIKQHISAVEQTRKITNAMKLVSSARMGKARKNAFYNAEHFKRIRSSMKDIISSPHTFENEFLTLRPDGHRIYIIVGSDKGMAGSYNSDLLKFALGELSRHKNAVVVTVGMLAADFMKKNGFPPEEEIAGMTVPPKLTKARYLTSVAMESYRSGQIHSVHIVYTSFGQDSAPKPEAKRLLPILESDYDDITPGKYYDRVEYFPSAGEVFNNIVPQYLTSIFFDILSQSYAAEQFYRMNAMQSATENADELLIKLNREYNMARQSAITQEITEISSAAELLKR